MQRSRLQRRLGSLTALAWALCAFASATYAQDTKDSAPPPQSTDIVTLGNQQASAVDSSNGRVAVNLAAGNNNQQANAAVVAQGNNVFGTGLVSQSLTDSPHQAGKRDASITGDALSGVSGLIAVNIAAGADNQEANLAIIALGSEGLVVTDATLSQTRSSQEPTGGPEQQAVHPESVTGISQGAFQGSSGLVQVNLIGGERNSSANIFALSVAGDVNP